MFSCRTIQTGKGKIVAACDLDVLGDTYSEDGVRLEVKEDFYGGEEKELHEVVENLRDFFTANLVGNELVEALVDEDIVKRGEVREVDGVKHVQLFRV